MKVGIEQDLTAEETVADAIAGHGAMPYIQQFRFVFALEWSDFHKRPLSFQACERDSLDEIALQEDEYN